MSIRDRIRHEINREEVGEESVLERIWRSILRWFMHVKRIGEYRLSSKFLERKMEGCRPKEDLEIR